MAKFLTGKELEDTFGNIIWDAKETLLMMSPFIKPGDFFKRYFERHLNNPKLHIIIVFGKNQDDLTRSLSKEDFEYFKQFLNISIVYVPNLHAKYYANDTKALITSINLYDYSFRNNIEFGIFFERNLLIDSITKNPDMEAWVTAMNVANTHEAIFIKRPVFEKRVLAIFGKSYVKSTILHDNTNKYYSYSGERIQTQIKKIGDFPEELDLGPLPVEKPTRAEIKPKSGSYSNPASYQATGYCIRTGKPIPFNPARPYSESAFQSWVQFGNADFPEQFCHKSGKPSYGKTSMNKPILHYY